jgi:galactose mutarotase-like enzyme
MGEIVDQKGIVSTIEMLGASSRAAIAPERGGMLTRLDVGGRTLLYLDEATLRDPEKNVRGGAPVLFPSPGKLAHDLWSRAGRMGSMKQHGFARNLPWQVVDRSPGSAPSVTLRLESTDETRLFYPWAFSVELDYTLEASGIRIAQRVENRGPSAMPFGFGFHPYFLVPEADKAGTHIPTKATRALDNTTKKQIELPASGVDLTGREVDLHLIDHGSTSAALDVPGRPRVVVSGSPEYTRWVIWTLADRDFVCVEPWTCPGNALNTGEGLVELPPGETRAMWISISVA